MRTTSLVLVALVTLVATALAGVPTVATAQNRACQEVLTDDRNATAGPGGQLAEAIGDQRSEIGSELNDRWFDARLANATSDRERAQIVAAEVERVEARLTTVDRCWSAHQAAQPGSADRLQPEAVERLRAEALTLHRRVNETEVEAANLPAPLQQRHGIDARSLDALERRIVTLRAEMAPEGATPTRRG